MTSVNRLWDLAYYLTVGATFLGSQALIVVLWSEASDWPSILIGSFLLLFDMVLAPVAVTMPELGWALGGLLLGGRIARVHLGMNRRKGKQESLRNLGIRWKPFCKFPALFSFQIRFHDAHYYRTRVALWIACGPLASAIAVILGVCSDLILTSAEFPFPLVGIWCSLNVTLFVAAAFPYRFRNRARRRWTDGLLIWDLMRLTDQQFLENRSRVKIAKTAGTKSLVSSFLQEAALGIWLMAYSVVLGCAMLGGLALVFTLYEPVLWRLDEVVFVSISPLLILIAPLGIIIHELGHALAATKLGGHVLYIRLGPQGITPKLKCHCLGYDWQITSFYPISGAVYSHFFVRDRYRTRRFLYIFAGPVISALAAGVGFLCYEWLQFSPALSLLSLVWFVVNLFNVVQTILPFKWVEKRVIKYQTDGLQMIQSLLFTDSEVDLRALTSRLTLNLTQQGDKQVKITADEAVSGYLPLAGDFILLYLVVWRLIVDADPRCGEYLEALISHPKITPAYLQNTVDQYLSGRLKAGTVGPDCDRLSLKLLETSKNSITARGTRGSVLIDLGRIDEGKAILLEVLKQTNSPTDRVFSNAFLAIAEQRLGNVELARQYAQESAREDFAGWLSKRLADIRTDS